MQQHIVCPGCEGKGEIPLSDILAATLGCFTIKARLTAPQLYEYDDWDGVGVTALNNRLEDLRKFGFLERERTKGGSGWTYFLNKKRKKAFTLIEILVLISITAIILALVLPAFCKHPKQLPEEPAPSRFTITAEHSTSEFQAIYLIKDTKTSNEWLYLECRTVNKPVISLIPK